MKNQMICPMTERPASYTANLLYDVLDKTNPEVMSGKLRHPRIAELTQIEREYNLGHLSGYEAAKRMIEVNEASRAAGESWDIDEAKRAALRAMIAAYGRTETAERKSRIGRCWHWDIWEALNNYGGMRLTMRAGAGAPASTEPVKTINHDEFPKALRIVKGICYAAGADLSGIDDPA